MEMDAVLYVLSSEGGWKDGKEYGQGTYYTKNGDKYTGQWDGNYEGQGVILSCLHLKVIIVWI